MKLRQGLLVILDGFGVDSQTESNAIFQAKKPNWDNALKNYPSTLLNASEQFVGLPRGFMGNSEVGHLNIGAGRVVYQDFSLISRAIETKEFFSKSVFGELLDKLSHSKKALHLMGLLSDGGVHSHHTHLYALLRLAKQKGIKDVKIHVFTDGRDTSPTGGRNYIEDLEQYMKDIGVGEIVSVSGRFYAMDRDKRWERIESAYNAIVCGEGASFKNALDYVLEEYDENITDEFIRPGVLDSYEGMENGDGVIFYNFRADRARQLTASITQKEWNFFTRSFVPVLSGFVMMTQYDASFDLPYVFEKPKIKNTLGEIISEMELKQLRIAETEKYAHVTYFFNGGDETVFRGEKRILVASNREVKTYDMAPEMRAREITQQLLEELKNEEYAFVVVNYANPDMVGHTGNIRAAKTAIEIVDECLGEIFKYVEKENAFCVVTADHGNCEKMRDEKGRILTSHTLNLVPFLLMDPKNKETKLQSQGNLCDIAPTILSVWGIEKTKEMTGKSLIT